jgi:hypothetical protein
MPDIPPPVIVPAPPAAAPVSPTGAAILPPRVVPYIMAGVTLAGALLAAPEIGVPIPPALKTVAAVIVFLVAPALGLASPGLRKPS